MKQVSARVVSSRESMPGIHLIWLEAPEIAMEAKPGQFVMAGCGPETTLPRPLSIHASYKEVIALLFRTAGKGTEWLSRRQVGDELNIFGPLGNGFSVSTDSKELLLVAGGIGVAPLYFLAQEACKTGRSVTLIYGTPESKRYPISAEIKMVACTDDGSVGHHGLVTDLIPGYAFRADQVFACGPLPMYLSMARMPALENKPVQVSLEVRMGCGRGLCYGCTIKTKSGLKKVCEHGPVFNLDDVLWEQFNPL